MKTIVSGIVCKQFKHCTGIRDEEEEEEEEEELFYAVSNKQKM